MFSLVAVHIPGEDGAVGCAHVSRIFHPALTKLDFVKTDAVIHFQGGLYKCDVGFGKTGPFQSDGFGLGRKSVV